VDLSSRPTGLDVLLTAPSIVLLQTLSLLLELNIASLAELATLQVTSITIRNTAESLWLSIFHSSVFKLQLFSLPQLGLLL
jgi:hypothetical protein